VHALIHATTPETVEKYLKLIVSDHKALAEINELRISVGNSALLI
jgi:hypothetical protein